MIYTVENSAKRGNPVRVFDATGEEVIKCTMANDETGEIERFAIDENGRCILDASKEELVKIRETRPLPLKVESI